MRFKRNVIRHRLIPLVETCINASAGKAVLRTAEILRAEEAYLDQITARTARKCVHETPGGKITLDLALFTGYDIWLRRRVLRHCLKATCRRALAADLETIDRLDRLAALGAGALSLPAGIRAVADRGQMILCSKARPTCCQELTVGTRVDLEWPRLWMRSRASTRRKAGIRSQVRSRSVCVDRDKLRPPLQVRMIRPGDRFTPLGMSGVKKVGDYLTDRKVARTLRDEIPLVCDGDGIVWLVGYEIADRVKVDTGTRRLLTITYGSSERKGHPTV